MLNEDVDSGMICVVIVDDGNGGSGLASAITVNFNFLQNEVTPLASKLIPTFVSMTSYIYSACDDLTGCIYKILGHCCENSVHTFLDSIHLNCISTFKEAYVVNVRLVPRWDFCHTRAQLREPNSNNPGTMLIHFTKWVYSCVMSG